MTPVESIPTGNSTGTHLKMMTLLYQTPPEMAFILICRENKEKYRKSFDRYTEDFSLKP